MRIKTVSIAVAAALIATTAPAQSANDTPPPPGAFYGPQPYAPAAPFQPPVFRAPPQQPFPAPPQPQFVPPPQPQFMPPPQPQFQPPPQPQFQPPPQPQFMPPPQPQFQPPPQPRIELPPPGAQVPPRPQMAPPPATGYEYPAPPAPAYRYGERDRWGSDTDWGNDWFGDWGSLFDGTGHIDMDFELDMRMDMEARGDADADTDTGFSGDSYYRGYEGYGHPYGGPYGPWSYGPPPGLYPPAPAPMPVPAPAPAAEAPSGAGAVSSDDDNDGVPNNGDFCPNTAEGTSVDAFGCAIHESIILHGVHFHTDSDQLTGESMTILDGVAETLLAYPDLKLEVSGHTDSDAEDAYNKDLSQRRADRVRQYLVDKGVESGNLTARGYGEERPVASNDTAEGKALNRRVELNRL